MRPLISIALLLAWSSQAATYHVDFSAGADAAAGTTTGTAWQHCPGDTNATGAALSATLAPGDTVKFKGGVTYSNAITLNWSGASGNPITYDGNSAGDWGTGRAAFDRNYQSFTTGFGGADGRGMCFRGKAGSSHLTFKGFEFRNIGGYRDDDPIFLTNCSTNPVTTVPDGYAFLFYDVTAGRNTNLRFENMYFHRIGQWRNTQPFSGPYSVSGGGIYIRNPQFMVVTNCEFTKMKVAIGLYTEGAGGSVENVEIVNVRCHNYMNWPIDVATLTANAVMTNISIHNSSIYDYYEMEYGNWQGCGDPPHTDGIFLRTGGQLNTYWTNVSVYNNDFYSTSIGASVGGTASIFISEGPSVNIYNNVFWAVPETRVIGIDHGHYSTQPQTVRIMNNTFYGGQRPINMQGPVAPSLRQVYVWNNVFQLTNGVSYGGPMIASEEGTNFTAVNWNLYWDPDWSVTSKYIIKQAPDYFLLSTARSIKNYEANGIYVNPILANAAGTPFLTANLKPQVTSPAIGAGTNLSAYFTTDKAGLVRGNGAWDIGAYQFAGSQQSTPPPTNDQKIQGHGSVRGQGIIRSMWLNN